MGQSKMIRVFRQEVEIAGISPYDDYFLGLADGVEDAFAFLCDKYLPKNGVALDIGANIGITSAILSQVLTQGQVHAFEPAPRVFAALARNIDSNGLRVTPHNVAISNTDGEVRFLDESAFGHITDDEKAALVQASKLDALVAKLGLDRIDLIKIDVEGAEWKVLEGGLASIKHFRPLIYLEFNSWCLTAYGKVNPLDFAEWLLGEFPVVTLVKNGTLIRVERDDALSFVHQNMVRSGCVQDLLLATDSEALDLSNLQFQATPLQQPTVSGQRSAEIDELRDSYMKTRGQLDAVLSSRSWRYTAPLRSALRVLGKR